MAEGKRKVAGATVVGGWTYRSSRPLGKGGNGEVFEAERNGEIGAIKLLKPRSSNARKARFRDEVDALRHCADIPGVISVLDADTDPPPGKQPWVVMGLARSLSAELTDAPTLRRVVEAVRDIAVVLNTMHSRGFSHRDIKPENLFFFQGCWTVGDFGLVSFEGKTGETTPNERIGPLFYMAPEMLNNAVSSDGKPADVFSLAKTLWVLATGQNFPLPGAYEVTHEAFRIGTYMPSALGSGALDKLIASATAFTPEDRPTMSQVCAELNAWLAPRKELPLAIKFDTSKFDSQIERRQISMQAEQSRENLRQTSLRVAALRVWETLRPFADDVIAGLKDAKFDPVTQEWNEADWIITIRATIQGLTPLALTLQVGIESLPLPNVRVWGRILLEGSLPPGTRLLLWDSDVRFMEGGSEEPLALQRLQADVAEGLQSTIDQAFTMSLEESASPLTVSEYHFHVTDCDGHPLAGAEVCLVGRDGASFKGHTNAQGQIQIGPNPLVAPIAYVAHPLCLGELRWELSTHTVVQMTRALNGGSFIYSESGRHWPGLQTDLEFIHDDLGRMYVYAENAVIDHGVRPPGYIALGKETHFKDKAGNCISICPQAVRGGSFLVNVSTLDTVARSKSD
jgi:serine/threonine protein kinase